MLELRDVPAPTPSRGEVRVRVRATAINRADLLQRMGLYPAPPGDPPDIPGLELAGEVDALGGGVQDLAIGDRVFGLVGGGAYAEQVVVHERALARIPHGMGFEQAAAVPEAAVTAYDAMVVQAGLSAGDTLLVHAVGSGVGTMAVQIARAIGATSIGTARSAAKLERARALGLAHGVLPEAGAFADRVLALTAGRGADVILDLVGGSYVAEDARCAAVLGRILVVGLVGGRAANVDLSLVLRRRLRVLGTALRGRPLEEKIAAGQLLARRIAPLLASGAVAPVVDRVLSLDPAALGHEALHAADTFGKIVLVP